VTSPLDFFIISGLTRQGRGAHARRIPESNQTMNTRLLTKSVSLLVTIIFAASAAGGEPPKTNNNDKNRKLADDAKRMMAEDKGLHDSVSAAIKAHDAGKVKSLLAKRGIRLPEINFTKNQCCVTLPPFPNGPTFCCD
jgi:hypothetical protein